ncbi:Hint domain-containing protein [Marinibacterium profundimaris]|uniref:Hedgehog/Intein (Hint) domain-containing protein n=1 Tax=Marinibacterium profundimaris TaxID=1679460 RepID=A0A225NGN0_9RHOB|nr:Hint domain-containing protein [Marinibacterium profundimaris]OWU72626.1 hypothetical protein ATO3_16295 [Marinibacterium profundimaris]
MLTHDFIVFGIDVLDAPAVSTNSTAGYEGEGTATVTGGSQPFDDDDVIVFSAVDTTHEGEITQGSAISGMTVYDSRADYEAGIVKYNYKPMNPGQTATVQSDISGLGDGYVGFNSNVLVPTDGGPYTNRLFVAPGTDLADTAHQPGGITVNHYQDMDLNGDGDTCDPLEKANGKFYAGDYTTPVICFTRGTMIRTPSGERPIEDLVHGDRVLTLDHGPQVIRWIGRRRVAANGRFAPVVIAAGTFGDHDRLVVSPNHRVLRQGAAIEMLFEETEVLVAAKHLVDNRNVTIQSGGTVEYIHILFDQHELIWANGMISESLFPGAEVNDEDQAESLAELLELFPQLARMHEQDPVAARRCLKQYEARLLTA